MANYNKLTKSIFNPVSDAMRKLEAIFPSAVKDGQLDIAALKEELGEFEEVGAEKYELTWAGKQAAKKLSQTDVPGRTLKYVPEDSKDADTTQNLYIEGDNLEVLKLLRQNYYGAVKMIYIDPPYNTGNDFIYDDYFTISQHESDEAEGDIVENERMVVNQQSSNRFHAKWLKMIYPRLVVAKDLLREEGVIFISIDDNEIENLKKVCCEIFHESNFIAQFIWQNKKGGGNDSLHVAIEHEYILAFAKNKESLGEFYELYSEQYATRYKEKDELGRFFWDTFKRKSGKQYYPIKCPDGSILQYDDDGNPISWLRSQARFNQDIQTGEVRIVKIGERWSVQFKQRMPEGKKPRSIFTTETVVTNKGTTSTGTDDVYKYFKKDVFSNPKPVELIKFLLGFGLTNKDTVLDFFSGSGTLCEAVMLMNALDNGNRKFIAVQVAEDIDKMLTSSSANAKRVAENAISVLDELNQPHVITSLAKERIRRAGDKIFEEGIGKWSMQKIYEEDLSETIDEDGMIESGTRANYTISKCVYGKSDTALDIGFRVFRTADTNIRWTHEALKDEQIEWDEGMLSDKDRLDFMPGYTDIDVVYEVLLRQRDIPLSATVEKLDIGKRTYLFADAYVVCLDDSVNVELVEALAAVEPTPIKYVLRDSAFDDNISLKDETIRRLAAYIARNSGEQKRAYTVEFI